MNNENIIPEQARAILILYHGIDNPTKEQVARFILFGEVVK